MPSGLIISIKRNKLRENYGISWFGCVQLCLHLTASRCHNIRCNACRTRPPHPHLYLLYKSPSIFGFCQSLSVFLCYEIGHTGEIISIYNADSVRLLFVVVVAVVSVVFVLSNGERDNKNVYCSKYGKFSAIFTI